MQGFDLDVIERSLGYLFLDGMRFTLTLTAIAMVGGIVFGTLLAMMRLSSVRAISVIGGAYVPAVLCLGFFTAARVSEQVRAGIQSLPRGQGMAGTALGLTLPQTYRFVLLPMAYRIILPPLTSEFMNIIKNSSVALTIGLVELTAAARSMQEFSFQVFEAFTAATTIYILVNVVVVFGMRHIERKVSVPGFIGKQVEVPAGH